MTWLIFYEFQGFPAMECLLIMKIKCNVNLGHKEWWKSRINPCTFPKALWILWETVCYVGFQKSTINYKAIFAPAVRLIRNQTRLLSQISRQSCLGLCSVSNPAASICRHIIRQRWPSSTCKYHNSVSTLFDWWCDGFWIITTFFLGPYYLKSNSNLLPLSWGGTEFYC